MLWVQGKKDEADALRKFADKSEHLPRLKAMIELAEIANTVDFSELDKNDFLLGVSNGVINLKTGKLIKAEREQFITKQSPVVYEEEATCPLWLKFLDDIMEGNQAMISYLQKLSGYALTGSTKEQCLFFLHGYGANGKSTFIHVLQKILGDYAESIQTETIMLQGVNSGPTPEVAKLRGVRLVVANELPEGKQINESLIKTMTGEDLITARGMYQNSFSFYPKFKLIMVGNHKPHIRGIDEGFWRRIRLIPFTAIFTKEKQDKNLRDSLINEMSGILNWMIEGALMFQQEGLDSPEKVQMETEGYQKSQDLLQAWVDECCKNENGVWTSADELFRSYSEWSCNNKEWEMSKRRFIEKLEEKGYRTHRKSRGMGFIGISVISIETVLGSILPNNANGCRNVGMKAVL